MIVRFLIMISITCTALLHAQTYLRPESPQTKSETEIDQLYDPAESNTGIRQIYDLMEQLKGKVGDIPPYIERIALYQLKVNSDDFSPGMVRFMRGHIEEIFMRSARKKMVTAPELRRVRILSTDTSFHMSSSIPTTDELWDLGEKLRIDGFLEGAITRTKEGDVLLSLQIFKHKTNEQVWSINLVAGPNNHVENKLFFESNIKATFNYWPIDNFIQDDISYRDNLSLYGYTLDLIIGEATTVNRLFYLSFLAGFGMYNPMSGAENDKTFNKLSRKFPVNLGFDLTAIMIQKQNRDEGYWLGITAGVRTLVFDNIWSVNGGLKSRMTPHFGIGFGVNAYPLNRTFEPSLLDVADNYELKMGMIGYEGYLQYYF